MENLEKIFKQFGFSALPETLRQKEINSKEAIKWFDELDFNKALDFYGLRKHSEFIKLFEASLQKFHLNNNFKIIVYALHTFLFADDKYGWESNLRRKIVDMLPAVVLLSALKKHITNMKKRNFDNVQIEKHKYRVFECCTIGLDTYGLHGVEISQLLWGSFFINANIIELGRLQYELKKYEYQIPNFEMKQKFCLGIHIFRGEKLDRNDVINSLFMAEDKVLSYFRELDEHPKFFIHSWLLAKNLDKYLEEGSNIKYFRELFDIVKYTEEDNPPSVRVLSDAVTNAMNKYAIEIPTIYIEPGRSIISTSGVTLYTVGSSKQVPRGTKYIAVDGGMADNPRPSMYRAEYFL